MLQPQEVIRVVGLLDSQNVSYWLDGGWGVDALAGEQTRQHQDLDLAIVLSEAGIVIRLLNETGYQVREDEMPTRMDLRDSHDHRIDLHPLALDDNGNACNNYRTEVSGRTLRTG